MPYEKLFFEVHALLQRNKMKKNSSLRKALFAQALLSFSAAGIFSQTIDLGHIVTVIESSGKVQTYISKEEIEKSPCHDLSSLLASKGFLVMSSGGSGTTSTLSAKGFSGFCCKVYIDGVAANQSGTGEFDWNSIDINSIESITINEVPDFSTDQFAGISVNIKTRFVSEKSFSLKTLASSYENSFLDTVTAAAEYRNFFFNTGIKINAEVKKSSNNYETQNNSTLENNWSSLGNLSGSFNTFVNNSLAISGTSKFFANTVKAFNTGSSLDTGVEKDFNSFQNVKIHYISGSGKIFSGNFTSQFNLIDYAESKNVREKIKIHQSDLFFTAENFYGFDGSSTFTLENKISGENKYRFHNTSKIFYTKDFSSWIKFSLGGGMIFSVKTDGKPEAEFLPQITISSAKTGLSFSAFREFTLPTFNQLYYEGSAGKGNENLTAEKGWALLGNWKSPFTFFPAEISYTYGKYANKIRWAYKDGVLTPQNTGSGTFKTFCAKISKEFEYASFYGSITNNQAKLENGKQIMWVPQWQYTLSATVHFGKFADTSLSWNYTGKRPQDNANLYWYDPVENLQGSVRLYFNDFSLIFSADNLLDQRTVYHDSYPIPSRSFTFGFTFKK